MFLALGACLGAALLSKLTTVLAIPFILAALLMRTPREPVAVRPQWLLRVTAVLALTLLVGGWHYARLWANYGSPVVGNWDTVLGFDWWQDEGYRTAPYFLRFGAALTHPWYCVFNSLPDGLYSTLWGDGLWSGSTAIDARMPWNQNLMAAGFLLALIPTLLLFAGAFAAVARLLRKPQPEWVLLGGFPAAAVAAMVWQSLQVPYSSTVKAFYFLSALLPLCALMALGWDAFVRRTRVAATILVVAISLWASVSYGSYWIRHGTSSAEIVRGMDHFEHGRPLEALDCFRQATNADTANLPARSLLVQSLLRLGRVDESLQTATATVQQFPNDSAAHTDSAAALAAKKRWDEAVAQARRAVALAPDNPRAHIILTAVLELSGKPADLEQASREALRVSPTNPTFHRQLAFALVAHSQSAAATNTVSFLAQAREHLLLAIRLADAGKQTTVSAAARQLLGNLPQVPAAASN
jgi:Flp pilus assembly protein TadD